jgi:hypothetical protein
MKNKLITIYLTSILMFALSGILMFDNECIEKETKVQFLDFSKNPVYIYPKEKTKNKN